MGKVYIIAIGAKARQGKDLTANFIKELKKNVEIVHFADELYNECRNIEHKFPLIVKQNMLYFLLDKSNIGQYLCFNQFEVPYLHDIFFKRKISVYESMKEKDSEILQFWAFLSNYFKVIFPNLQSCQYPALLHNSFLKLG